MAIEGKYCGNKVEVTTTPHEMRMSHWVYAPKVVNLETQDVLLDLSNGLYDLTGVYEVEKGIAICMRKYPGSSPEVTVIIAQDGSSYQYNNQSTTLQDLMVKLREFL